MMRENLALCAISILTFSLVETNAQTNYETVKQELKGSKITIAVPQEWNKKVLLIAHGLVPEGAPLIANFYPNPNLYDKLIDEGWMVASTSYRRNGLIIEDGVEDIEFLRQYLVKEFGEPQMVIVQGSSMGGIIGTLIAEAGDPGYHGVLNMGAALHARDSLANFELRHKPLMPVLFLTNQSEAAAPRKYVETAGANNDLSVFWLVKRDGHVNVNGTEQGNALAALVAFIGYPKEKAREYAHLVFVRTYRSLPRSTGMGNPAT